MLETRNLGTGYGNLQVVRGVSIAIRKGEIVALVGANGAGKTTTLRAIVGLLPAWEGEVLSGRKAYSKPENPSDRLFGVSLCARAKISFSEDDGDGKPGSGVEFKRSQTKKGRIDGGGF